jgi:hypothetical protein
MPSPSTALQIITDALYITNAVGVDQTLTAKETSDGLRILNDLIEDWNTQNLAVYASLAQSFVTVAGQANYTIGTGGNWNTTRPVRIDSPAYTFIAAGNETVSVPMVAIPREQYDLIELKSMPGPYPEMFLYENTFPLGNVALWPVPNQVLNVRLRIDTQLTQAATAATSLSFPPGYVNAFKFNLATMLAPWFGKNMATMPDIVMKAREYLANIKRANLQTPVSQFDNAMTDRWYNARWRGY